MGVPGDMNLELLDFIDEVEGLEWSEFSIIQFHRADRAHMTTQSGTQTSSMQLMPQMHIAESLVLQELVRKLSIDVQTTLNLIQL
jgi:hypothetical protein